MGSECGGVGDLEPAVEQERRVRIEAAAGELQPAVHGTQPRLVRRDDAREHVAFGHGIHFCIGAALARAEGRITVEAMLDRLDDIEIDAEHHGPPGDRKFRYVPTYMLRGLSELHLTFTGSGRTR